MQYRNTATGQVQSVGEWERVRRTLLEAAGWVAEDDGEANCPDESAPAVTGGVTVRIGDELVVLAPGAQPMAAPGYKLVEVTANDSEMAEFIEVPDGAAPKRKRSK